jgi:hypothetical protein
MTRDWLLPRGPKESPWWVLLGVLAHVALVVLVAVSIRRTFPSEPVIIVLAPDGGAAAMPWAALGDRPRSGATEGAQPATRSGGRVGGRTVAPAAPVVAPDTVLPAGPPDRRVAEGRGEGPPGGVRRGEGPPGVVREGGRLLGARFGDGRLWVRPWDAIAAAIASAGHDSLDAAGNAALLDSVIEARVTAFLLAMPPDSFAIPRQPSWVTEINGKKWGMDGSWIYLGGLKLPSALLALIPFPQGNYDAAKQAADLQRIREDIMQAARRAESLEQFKKNVKETRERRDAEREAKRNQAVKPDSIKT